MKTSRTGSSAKKFLNSDVGKYAIQRYKRLLKEAMSDVSQQLIQPHVPNGLVTVVAVDVGVDLDLAIVRLSILGTAAQGVLAYCEQQGSVLRGALGHRVGSKLHRVPSLRFTLDDGAARANRIERVLHDLKKDHVPEDERVG